MRTFDMQVYRHIRDHAGYVVGESAKGAIVVARLVRQAETMGLKVRWEHEDDDWIDCVGDCAPKKTWLKRFENGTHEVLRAWVENAEGDSLASLGHIVVGPDSKDYIRSTEYELLAEAVVNAEHEAERRALEEKERRLGECAPELLGALRMMLAIHPTQSGHPEFSDEEAVRAAANAIAKAEERE